VAGSDGAFTVHTEDRFGRSGASRRESWPCRRLLRFANLMGIPGEKLSKVHHYYNDPHPYFGMDVVVIGGKNSAAIAALERGGAERGSHWSIVGRRYRRT